MFLIINIPGLQQWKEAIGENPFYGKPEPAIFMTDDSNA